MMKPSLLVIDDNPDVIKALKVLFHLDDIQCFGALSPEDGLDLLSKHEIDLVIQDMNFSSDTVSGEEGIQLFKDIREAYVDMPIILLTAWANLESAVQLVKAGAADYLSKPWDDDKYWSRSRTSLSLINCNLRIRQIRGRNGSVLSN